VLAFPCLAGSLYQSTVLVALVKTGKRADAEVVRIETGVKGAKEPFCNSLPVEAIRQYHVICSK